MRQLLLSFMCFFYLLVFGNEVLSQVSSDDDLASYFDDKGISTSKNTIGLNFASSLVGDIHFTYERKLLDLWSIEIGVGYLLPLYLTEVNYMIFPECPFSGNPDSGYSYNIGINFFYSEFPEDLYNAINFRQRYYFVENDWVHFEDIYYSMGVRVAIKGKLIFDYNLGIGYRFVNRDTKPKSLNDNGIILPIALKLEYLF